MDQVTTLKHQQKQKPTLEGAPLMYGMDAKNVSCKLLNANSIQVPFR